MDGCFDLSSWGLNKFNIYKILNSIIKMVMVLLIKFWNIEFLREGGFKKLIKNKW